MNDTNRITIFAIVIGFFFSLKVISLVFPSGVGVSILISSIMAVFWPYLSLRQNISIAIMRFIVALPSNYQQAIQAIHFLDLKIYGVIMGVDAFASTMFNSTEMTVYRDTVKGVLIDVAPEIQFAKNLLLFLVPISLLLYIVVPYVLFLFFHKMKLYERLPMQPPLKPLRSSETK